MRSWRFVLLLLLMLAWLFPVKPAPFSAYRQLPIAMHLHTQFSDGVLSIPDLITAARQAGFQGVLITDHTDRFWEYPINGWLIGIHLNSLHEEGFGKYVQACYTAQADNQDMVVIPGFEASPYYFWSGRLLKGDLTNHQWMKHLVVVGIEDPRVYYRLPMLQYGTSKYQPAFTDDGDAPYADFVNAVTAAGGMAFWAHPLINHKDRMCFCLFAQVTRYAESLLTIPQSNGIAVHGVNDGVALPGGVWDQALLLYCAGKRSVPPWGYSEIDYHNGPFVPSATVTVLLDRNIADPTTRKNACVDAIRRGRFFFSNCAYGDLSLDDDTLSVPSSGAAIPGETLRADTPPTLHYSIRTSNPILWVHIIRNGIVVSESTSSSGVWTDPSPTPPGQLSYYRLVALTRNGNYLLANPIFLAGVPVPTVQQPSVETRQLVRRSP